VWLRPRVSLRLRRRLASADRQPIRITFDVSAVSAAALLTTTQRSLIVDNVLVDARNTLQGLLKVDAVVGNLFASRSCLSAYSNGQWQRCRVSVKFCQHHAPILVDPLGSGDYVHSPSGRVPALPPFSTCTSGVARTLSLFDVGPCLAFE
jgi:hypothetical protein